MWFTNGRDRWESPDTTDAVRFFRAELADLPTSEVAYWLSPLRGRARGGDSLQAGSIQVTLTHSELEAVAAWIDPVTRPADLLLWHLSGRDDSVFRLPAAVKLRRLRTLIGRLLRIVQALESASVVDAAPASSVRYRPRRRRRQRYRGKS